MAVTNTLQLQALDNYALAETQKQKLIDDFNLGAFDAALIEIVPITFVIAYEEDPNNISDDLKTLTADFVANIDLNNLLKYDETGYENYQTALVRWREIVGGLGLSATAQESFEIIPTSFAVRYGIDIDDTECELIAINGDTLTAINGDILEPIECDNNTDGLIDINNNFLESINGEILQPI